MSNKRVLTEYYEISEYLFRRERVRNSKDFSALVKFETQSIKPSADCIKKAEDVIAWNSRDISSYNKRIDTYLDEIERLRKYIKSSEENIDICTLIFELDECQKGIENKD